MAQQIVHKKLLLSDKNESRHFHTFLSTNKQGYGNLVLKTSPLIIKMWFKRNICKVFIIREGGFLCRIVSPVSAEASSLALCRTPETMATIVIPVSIRDAFLVETLGGVSGANGT